MVARAHLCLIRASPVPTRIPRNAWLRRRFEPQWRLGWVETVEKVVAKLQPPPTVIILNTGMWGSLSNGTLAAGLLRAAQRAAPRVLWKTTTRMRCEGPPRHAV